MGGEGGSEVATLFRLVASCCMNLFLNKNGQNVSYGCCWQAEMWVLVEKVRLR